MTKIGDAKRKLHGMITGKPDNFSWLIDGKLAGSAIPTSKEEIEWAKEEGVKSVVTIREEPLDNEWVKDLNYLHVMSDDMGIPEFSDLVNSIDFIPSCFAQSTSSFEVGIALPASFLSITQEKLSGLPVIIP